MTVPLFLTQSIGHAFRAPVSTISYAFSIKALGRTTQLTHHTVRRPTSEYPQHTTIPLPEQPHTPRRRPHSPEPEPLPHGGHGTRGCP